MKARFQKLGSVVLVAALFFLAMVASFAAPTNAQTVSQSAGAAAIFGGTNLNLTLPVTTGNAIVVFEWFGTQSTPCNYIATPTDSVGNTFHALGSCLADQSFGAMEAFDTNTSSTASDTVKCKWNAYASGNVIACYAFVVSSPGTIKLAATGTGTGSTAFTAPFSAPAYSLILATAGVQLNCAPASISPGWSAYIPSSACSNGFGMTGEYYNLGSSGAAVDGAMGLPRTSVWAELAVQISTPAIITTSTSTTSTSYSTTIVGWLAPDAAHFSATYIIIIFPLAGMVVMLVPFMMFNKPEEVGDRAIYPALFGFTIGGAAADLGTNSNTPLTVPFAFVFVSALLLFLWWWDS
jgi:hypothetical protein